MIQYYLNNNTEENSSCCSRNEELTDHLRKSNYLSEFVTSEDKELARDNLGISEIITLLKNRIDRKIINAGGVVWDDEPTEGHTDRVVSSDGIYRYLLNFATDHELDENTQNLWSAIIRRINELTPGEGAQVTNDFGDSESLAISQKTLTEEFEKIWNKIDIDNKVNLQVYPDSFAGLGCNVHVVMSPINPEGSFDNIKLYLNDNLLTERENVQSLTYDTTTDRTSVVKCVATIDGIEYTKTSTITKYPPMWVGTVQPEGDLNNIVNPYNAISSVEGLNKRILVNFNAGDHLAIILDLELNGKIKRVDMSGIEILLNSTTIEINGTNYLVYISKNQYKQGSYYININS